MKTLDIPPPDKVSKSQKRSKSVVGAMATPEFIALYAILKGRRISWKQLVLLRKLTKENLNMTDIAKMFYFSTTSATQIVDLMEERNWVVRIISIDDRRKRIIQITDNGREAYEAIISKYADNLEQIQANNRDTSE